jgi:hypothetical protein
MKTSFLKMYKMDLSQRQGENKQRTMNEILWGALELFKQKEKSTVGQQIGSSHQTSGLSLSQGVWMAD